jgi:hypothetical protein
VRGQRYSSSKNLPASVRYNAEPEKSTSRNAVLDAFPRRQPSTDNKGAIPMNNPNTLNPAVLTEDH